MKTIIASIGLALFAASALCAPQDYRTTPVPILKQINRHNDDGSYSYGYEGADGTYKIETKYPTGEVHGKYGYVGDDGKLREVEYGASKRGFEPSGSDINVAPPTISNGIEPNSRNDNRDYDDGEYREDPTVYYKSGGSRTAFSTRFQSPAYQRPQYRAQPQIQFRPQLLPQPQVQPQYYQPQYYQRPQYFNPQPRFQPLQLTFDPAIFSGHPATNFDLNTGSYTISYTS